MKLGQVQSLRVAKNTPYGLYLTDEIDEILLPKKETTADMIIDSKVEVFIYKDSEDRPIATTTTPPLTLGKVACLKVKETTSIGAFLDWGLLKDLLLPFKEQTVRVQAGDKILVALYIDKSQRLCATMKIYDYLEINSPYKKEDNVEGTVYEIIENFGVFVAVDNRYSGLIPSKEVYQPFKVGQTISARVTNIKEDGKLDLSIREKVHIQLNIDAEMIYDKLQEASGFLPYHDKSDAKAIKSEFNISKNAFKRAIGRLQKEGKITILNHGIESKN